MGDIIIDTSKLGKYSFQIGRYRPPSEGARASLLLQITENCPWDRCSFCCLYRGQKFQFRTVAAIKKDIDAAKALADELIRISKQLGFDGKVKRKLISTIAASDPSLGLNSSFITVANWMLTGGKTAFLQDSNSIVMKPADLIEVLKYIRSIFPSLERVTSYARSHTLCHRKLSDLKKIREAGLDRLHAGLETGDDELLQKVCKGVTSQQQIEGGLKAKQAGFELSEYFMTDLGGRKFWRQHAINTARVLSEIDPDYIRSRPLAPIVGTPIYDEYTSGNLILSSPLERLEELKLMVENLNFNGRLVFDHSMNSWCNPIGQPLFSMGHEGYKFPEEKSIVLELIDLGLSLDESCHIHVEDLMRSGTL
ncbi:MAG: radical SAM protein [Planctomycetes bacterium]|nr:radical SAM protein [Planctomycetota bacterium]